jgi:rare lipoprotein A
LKIATLHASAVSQNRVNASAMTVLRLSVVVVASLVVANCGTSKTGFLASHYGASASPKVVSQGERIPVGGGYTKVGKPYIIAGRVYQPSDPKQYSSTGLASWYGDDFHGRMTANGEVFNTFSVSAAHPTLPLPSYIRVTNLSNGRSIVARVNDRGPFHSNRLLDVSERVAEALAFRNSGTANVKIDYLGKAPQEGSDDARLIATLTTDGTPAALKDNASATLMSASSEPQLPLGEQGETASDDAAVSPASPMSVAAPVASTSTINPVLQKVASATFAVPLPPSRSLARSLTTSAAVKPVLPAKPMQTLSLKAPQAVPLNGYKTAQAQVPVPVARPSNGLFYAPQLVPTAGLQTKRLTPQTFVPLNSPQTF